MTTATTPRFDEIEKHPDDAVTASTFFPPEEATMRALAQELFGTHWRSVVVGPCIEGAVFEVSFQTAPEIRYSDGSPTARAVPRRARAGRFRGRCAATPSRARVM